MILTKSGKSIVSIAEAKDDRGDTIFRAIHRTSSRDENLTILKDELVYSLDFFSSSFLSPLFLRMDFKKNLPLTFICHPPSFPRKLSRASKGRRRNVFKSQRHPFSVSERALLRWVCPLFSSHDCIVRQTKEGAGAGIAGQKLLRFLD